MNCESAGGCPCGCGPSSQSGYTYLVVLVLLAVMSLAAALTLEVAQTNARRSGEAELLAIGKEFERAFASYYRQSPVGGRRYPARLEDLTRDPRLPGVRRYLRRLYVDPLSGAAWGTIPAPGGGIMGIYSTAAGRPYRTYSSPLTTLDPANADAGASAPAPAQTYADWRFGFDPAMDLPSRMRIITPTPAAAAPAPAFNPPESGGPSFPGGAVQNSGSPPKVAGVGIGVELGELG